MALNLKTLAVRSITAVVFVAVLLSCVLWNYFSFSIFFFFVSMIGLYEFYKIVSIMGTKPILVSGYTAAILLYFSNTFHFNESFFTSLSYELLAFKFALIIGSMLIFTTALFSRKENFVRDSLFTLGGVIYTVLPFSLLNLMVYSADTDENFDPLPILGIIFLIWSNDTFAYLGGSLYGKNKMIERVSPGKTWEGTLTGIVITFALSFLFDTLLCPLPGYLWPILGICVPILATIGDLIESKLKREAGVKDSGSILPGHGGILDRFDSLIFVAPFAYLILSLFRS
ncbi:MAG TPA: phosphatidate cytidylyltransferase [Bacteroidia bacterium]|nr:phosphatidate cytidylyltransferase [Bacteroidia bacterium]